ncbi:hypothetical protein RJ640_009026 [Escallonia rubra]|uniref:Peptidase C14 caspase domain-containing protein n=1 Tax=Escallonia rubra TaxID=112253 RepID=A0AA88RBR9_9ASTE|nr:hypothetical protein RJ640_009026 [Escallonia rubra]
MQLLRKAPGGVTWCTRYAKASPLSRKLTMPLSQASITGGGGTHMRQPLHQTRIIPRQESWEDDPLRIPTKYNMQRAMNWLVQGCQSGDSLVFYYTGHGLRVPDFDGDERDGYDEALCPVDYMTAGKILDDEINARIVRPLPHGAKLHAIIETCHSGTVLDLQFLCRMNQLVFL